MRFGHTTNGWRWWQRSCDVAISLLLCLLFLPSLLLICLLIWVDSPGSPVFYQRRVGKDGKTFFILKLRTMYVGSSSEPVRDERTDLRITPVGHLLRPTKIDEALQFFNVLKGDMSLVGPRPMTEELHEERVEEFPHYAERTAAFPGITGLAALQGSEMVHFGGYKAQWRRDRFWIEHQSFRFYWHILIKTILLVSAPKRQTQNLDYALETK